MMMPTRKNLAESVRDHNGKAVSVFCSGTILHPNPKLRKYYWRVFTADTPWEGDEFFRHAPMLCTAEYKTFTRRYREEGVSYLVYNYSLPRLGTILDPNHPRWEGVKFAPALEIDTDPEWNGHK